MSSVLARHPPIAQAHPEVLTCWRTPAHHKSNPSCRAYSRDIHPIAQAHPEMDSSRLISQYHWRTLPPRVQVIVTISFHSYLNGIARNLTPVAAKTAFPMAGATQISGVSPAPA